MGDALLEEAAVEGQVVARGGHLLDLAQRFVSGEPLRKKMLPELVRPHTVKHITKRLEAHDHATHISPDLPLHCLAAERRRHKQRPQNIQLLVVYGHGADYEAAHGVADEVGGGDGGVLEVG